MKHLEQFTQYPLREKLGRLGATALIALTLNTARDSHAQDPEDDWQPQEVAEVIPPDSEVKPVDGERVAIALTDARLRSEPSTTSRLVGNLRAGEQAPITDQVEDGQWVDLRGVQSDVWYELAWQGETAFVWSGLVAVETLDKEAATTDRETNPSTATSPSEVDPRIMQAIREVETEPALIETSEQAAIAFGGVELEPLPTETWELEAEGLVIRETQAMPFMVEAMTRPEQRIIIEGQAVPFGVLSEFEVPDFMWDYYTTLTADGVPVAEDLFFVSGIFVPYEAGYFDFLIPHADNPAQWGAAQVPILTRFTAIRINADGEIQDDTDMRFQTSQITTTGIRLHGSDTIRSGQQIILAVSSKTSEAGFRVNGNRSVLEAFQSGEGAMLTLSYTIFYQPR